MKEKYLCTDVRCLANTCVRQNHFENRILHVYVSREDFLLPTYQGHWLSFTDVPTWQCEKCNPAVGLLGFTPSNFWANSTLGGSNNKNKL